MIRKIIYILILSQLDKWFVFKSFDKVWIFHRIFQINVNFKLSKLQMLAMIGVDHILSFVCHLLLFSKAMTVAIYEVCLRICPHSCCISHHYPLVQWLAVKWLATLLSSFLSSVTPVVTTVTWPFNLDHHTTCYTPLTDTSDLPPTHVWGSNLPSNLSLRPWTRYTLSGSAQSNAHQPTTDQSLTFLPSWPYHLSLSNHQLIPMSNPHPQCYGMDSTQGCSTE